MSPIKRMAPFVVVLSCALAIAACGSSNNDTATTGGSAAGSASTSSSATASNSVVTAAKAAFAKGKTGDFQPPPTSGPKAVKGKSVWYISCGQAFEACVVQANAFKAAGAALGWKVTIQDGKADPSTAAQIIRQAVAAKVNGMVVAYFDCPGIKSALLEAKRAKMPVVGLGSLDCNSKLYGGTDQSLYAANPKLRGSDDPAAWYASWASARAQYVIAKTDGKADILSIYENSQAIQQANGKAFADEIAKCSTCKIKRTAFTFAQVPNPFTQQMKSAIQSDPNASVVANGIDALMFLGLQPAVQQAGRKVAIEGAELNPGNIALIRDGKQTSAVAVPYGWFAWAAADTLNRVFAGGSPSSFPDEGTGWQYVDKANNLPSGKTYEPPVDYRAAYAKIWGG